MDKLKPTNDFVFKKLFAKKGNEDLLIDLLNSILNIKISKIEISKDVTLEKEMINNKLGILDIKATINSSDIINIEMQVQDQNNMIERSLYYWTGLFHENLITGEDYIDNKKVICINILNFNIFEDGEPHEVARIKRDYKNKILTKKFEIHYIQIPKFIKEHRLQNENAKEENLKNWLYFISQDSKGVEKAMEENEKIKKANEELEYLSGDEYTRRLAFLRDKAIRDETSRINLAKSEGIQEGIRKGEKQKQKEIAKKMLSMKIDIKTIMEVTNLTEEEIKDINKSNK